MSEENRLTAEQLAALGPGDTVTVESAGAGRRPSLAPGTVVRIEPTQIIVAIKGRHGRGTYIERYSRRDGLRVGRGDRAQLIDVDVDERAARDLHRQRTRQIDVLYRRWSRHPGDAEALRRLHAAIEEYMDEQALSH